MSDYYSYTAERWTRDDAVRAIADVMRDHSRYVLPALPGGDMADLLHRLDPAEWVAWIDDGAPAECTENGIATVNWVDQGLLTSGIEAASTEDGAETAHRVRNLTELIDLVQEVSASRGRGIDLIGMVVVMPKSAVPPARSGEADIPDLLIPQVEDVARIALPLLLVDALDLVSPLDAARLRAQFRHG